MNGPYGILDGALGIFNNVFHFWDSLFGILDGTFGVLYRFIWYVLYFGWCRFHIWWWWLCCLYAELAKKGVGSLMHFWQVQSGRLEELPVWSHTKGKREGGRQSNQFEKIFENAQWRKASVILGQERERAKEKLSSGEKDFSFTRSQYYARSLTHPFIKHHKNCECCPRQSLFKGHNVIVNSVVLNCNWNVKCQVSGHKSLGLLFEDFLQIFRKSEIFPKI